QQRPLLRQPGWERELGGGNRKMRLIAPDAPIAIGASPCSAGRANDEVVLAHRRPSSPIQRSTQKPLSTQRRLGSAPSACSAFISPRATTESARRPARRRCCRPSDRQTFVPCRRRRIPDADRQ